jgi:hypothetical protein
MLHNPRTVPLNEVVSSDHKEMAVRAFLDFFDTYSRDDWDEASTVEAIKTVVGPHP